MGDFLAKTIVLHCSCDQAESQFETEIFRIPQVIQVSFSKAAKELVYQLTKIPLASAYVHTEFISCSAPRTALIT